MNANPGAEAGYALDFLTVVRHVATALDEAAPTAPSIAEIAKGYRHPVPADLTRVRTHHGIASDAEAVEFLTGRAVTALGEQVEVDSSGGLRLTRAFDDLRYEGRKVHRVVEVDDEDERRALRAVYSDLTNDRVFYVTRLGARGASREVQYRLHPLAHAIPQVSETEFFELAADIKQRGIEVPIVVFDDQVLDGRHRLAIASALKIPLRVNEFFGTEAQARDHVMSLNVFRRHLTVAQRGLIVRELYLPEAKERAKERQRDHGGTAPNTPRSSARSVPDSAKAAEIAAKASGLATVRTIESMAPVDDAPKTKARIRSGEIKTAAEARREAIKETGSGEPERPPVAQPRSAWDRLGCALGDVRSAGDAVEQDRKGNVSDEQILARIGQIREQLDRLTALLTPES